jgi:hypothetical protein
VIVAALKLQINAWIEWTGPGDYLTEAIEE